MSGSRAPTSPTSRTASSRLRPVRAAAASPRSARPRATPASGCGTPAWPPTRWSPARAASTSCARCAAARLPDVHGLARALAEAMVADDPDRLTLKWKKADRGEQIFVDVNRNAYAQHAVAPYGVRAREGAPVAMPIHWDELSDAKLKPDRWTVKTPPTGSSPRATRGRGWRGARGRCLRLARDGRGPHPAGHRGPRSPTASGRTRPGPLGDPCAPLRRAHVPLRARGRSTLRARRSGRAPTTSATGGPRASACWWPTTST